MLTTRKGWRRTLTVPLLALILSLVTFVPASGQVFGVKVINHVFAPTVVRDSQGRFSAPEVLIGFRPGTASFDTLTHLLLDAGTYHFEMRLFDPSGNTLAQYHFPAVVVQRNGWVEALYVPWNNVRFQQAGEHRLVLYLDGRVVATFYLLVS